MTNSAPSTGLVALAGASGHIGRAVAAELAARQQSHLLLLRKQLGEGHNSAAPDSTRDVCITDVTKDGDFADAFRRALKARPIDTVISCLASRTGVRDDAWAVDYQANSNLLRAAEANGARHFILLSAICVQKPRLEFQRAKLAFERELADSKLTFTIVRPTAFFKSLSGQIPRVLDDKPYLLFADGQGTACKPISETDLARFLVDCIDDRTRDNTIQPIGGPGNAITPREQGELLFRLAGKPARFRSVPVGMFSVAASILTPLGFVVPPLAAKAELARIGRYYATESMLLWDSKAERYDAVATPSFGETTLESHYRRLLQDGLDGYEAGEQKLF